MIPVRPFTIRRDSVRAKLLFAMSDDPNHPTPLRVLQALAANDKAANVELSKLQSLGAIERVGRGLYVRHVEEVREFRQ